VHAPGLSFHAARPVAALDRIAVNRGVKLERAGVHRSDPARVASDHLPVWADLRLG
jgi:endonuclease/exonuclease/phosphatase family metal-dependent hydrolase